MKHPSLHSLAALLCAAFLLCATVLCISGRALADEPTQVYTTPVGYVTETIPGKGLSSDPDIYKLIGLNLQSSIAFQDEITTITSSSISVDTANFTALLDANKTYVLEVVTGAGSGLIQEVTTWNDSDITGLQDLTVFGVGEGDMIALRPAFTIQDVFGSATETELIPGTLSTADIVWLPNGSGGFDRYHVQPASPPFVPSPSWVKVGGGAQPENTPIIYVDGLIIQRRGTNTVELLIAGEVKTSPFTISVIQDRYNYFSSVYPALLSDGAPTSGEPTVASQGIDAQMQAGSVTTADILWIPQANGSYIRYFNNPPAPPFKPDQSFDIVGGGAVDPATIKLSSGFIIQRRGPDANFSITPPSGYSDL